MSVICIYHLFDQLLHSMDLSTCGLLRLEKCKTIRRSEIACISYNATICAGMQDKDCLSVAWQHML